MRAALACLALLSAASGTAHAAPGDADSSLGTDGFAFARFECADGADVDSMAVQPSGKIVVAVSNQCGSGHLIPADLVRYLARFNPDGSVDESFGQGGTVALPITLRGVGRAAVEIAVASDGGILVAGGDPYASSVTVSRYTADGALDLGFGENGRFTGGPDGGKGADVVVDSSGTVTLVGRVVRYDEETGASTSTPLLVRLTSDGRPDQSFGDNGISTDSGGAGPKGLSEAVIDSQDRVVATADGNRIARYLGSGELDRGFGDSGVSSIDHAVDGYVSDLEVDSQDRAVAASSSGDVRPPRPAQVTRLTPQGSLDPEFGDGGVATPSYPRTVLSRSAQDFSNLVLDGDRPILASLDYALVTGRLTADGSPDASYGDRGWSRIYVRKYFFNDGPVGDIVLSPAGVVVGAGDYGSSMAIARLSLSSATLDTDGDGVPNNAERCPAVFGACPRYERRLTLDSYRGDRDRFRGDVLIGLERGAPFGYECFEAPGVSLYRVKPGPNRRVAKLTVGSHHALFRFDLPRVRGEYYARVGRTLYGSGICGPARSNTVTLR